MKFNIKPSYLKLTEAARYLGYGTPRPLRRAIHRKELPGYRFTPRGHLVVKIEELEEWMQGKRWQGPRTTGKLLHVERLV